MGATEERQLVLFTAPPVLRDDSGTPEPLLRTVIAAFSGELSQNR